MRIRCWTRRWGALRSLVRWNYTASQKPPGTSPFQITQALYDTNRSFTSKDKTKQVYTHTNTAPPYSSELTGINLAFLDLLQTNSNVSIFSFLVENITTIRTEFLNVFLYNLLVQNNISAVTTLLHLVFSQVPSFKLATEFWSLYTVKVCEQSDHLGSVLIYHHLIDNYLLYSEANLSYYNHENSHFPFLLTPTLLEQLAIIFLRQGDPMRIEGILRYFKRFYSYLGHKGCYKALLLSVVEAYSNKGDLAGALEKFKGLALTFRGHTLEKDWAKLQKLQRTSVFANHVWRRNNIKQNTLYPTVDTDLKTQADFDQDEMVLSHAYNPIRERNVYTAPNTFPIPILNGTLRTADLPCFQTLITDHVLKIMNSTDKDVWNLVSFIVSNHFMLHIYVIRSLCDLDYVQEALLLVKKLPNHLLFLHKVMDVKDENFYNIIHACEVRLLSEVKEPTANFQLPSPIPLLFDTINYYSSSQIENNLSLSPRVFSKFLSCVLACPAVSFDEIRPHLDNFLSHRSSSKSCIYLLPEDYGTFVSICNSQKVAKYSSVLKSY